MAVVAPVEDARRFGAEDPVTDPPKGRRVLRAVGESALVAPSVGLVLLLLALPTAYVVYRSFFDWQPGYPSPFVGLRNYAELFGSDLFRQVMANQAVLLLGLPIYTLVPLAIALLLFERVRGAAMFRTIFFFPSVLAPAVVGIMMRSVLADDGMLNGVLDFLHLGALQQPWLTSETLVKPVVILVLTWAGLGVGVVIFSSALSALPLEQMEAAVLDGAGWWQRLRYVVMPELRPTIELWVAFQAISVFAYAFAWIFVLTSGGPNGASTTLDYDVYQNALGYGFFGVAAAESVVLLAIVAALGVITVLVSRWRERGSEVQAS